MKFYTLQIATVCLLAAGALACAANKQQVKQTNKQQVLSVAAASQVAEKKQGDVASDADEYVQVKPEEITINEQNKDVEPNVALSLEAASSSMPAEHKSAKSGAAQALPGGAGSSSVDDELSAHLAHDSIVQQESAYRPYATAVAPTPAAALGVAGYAGPLPLAPPPPMAAYRPVGGARKMAPVPLSGRPYGRPARAPHARPAPAYMAHRGKPVGGHPLASSYQPPVHGYQPAGSGGYQQTGSGGRQLPRGAAAGYAAFREFVRAQTNRYKLVGPAASSGPAYPPPAAPAAPSPAGYPGSAAPPLPAPAGYPAKSYSAGQAAPKNKLGVVQAYIPQVQQAPAADAYEAQPADASPALAKLYGGHAPQGTGRPEYSKDFGMVIHYPQATVYTQPMTVDQLHKLAGSGISQVLEHLQYNLASGQRDESNTLRANKQHHLGNGLTLHAKEYYAPGKSGHYVPTTAAVLSAPAEHQPAPQAANYEPVQPVGESNVYLAGGQATGKELGSGYERVKQAVAAGSLESKYNNRPAEAQPVQPAQYQPQQQYQQQQQQQQQQQLPQHTYGESGKSGAPEALSQISSMLGAELDSLYKANAALAKQLEPEFHAQLQAFSKSAHARRPLQYTEHDHKHPFTAYAAPTISYQPTHPGHSGNRHAHQRPRSPRKGPNNRYRPAGAANQQQRPYGAARRPQAHMVDQALQHQMTQLLNDLHMGDEQYNAKPTQAANQGYPHKVLQKYQQPQRHQASGYNQNEGVEFTQGPHDQIGEISELLEALKGTLETSAHPESYAQQQHQQQHQASQDYSTSKEQPKQIEEVRYLSNALGQAPTYALQVPVTAAHPAEPAAPEYSANSPADQPAYQAQPQQPQQYQQQQQYHQAEQSHGYQGAQPAHKEQAEQQADAYAPNPANYLPAAPAAYGMQAQQSPAPAADYQQPQQQQQPAPHAGDSYAPAAQAAVSGVYPAPERPQQQPQQAAQYQSSQSAQSGYTSSEHTQVINHLVPVQQPQYQPQSAAKSYELTSNQPANQIALSAPTDSQYAQAQSLSSFVDSLPSDYQELLRQPAILDGPSRVSHLAALAHEAPTTPLAAAAPAGSSAYESSGQQQQHHDQQAAASQQSYQSAQPATSGSQAAATPSSGLSASAKSAGQSASSSSSSSSSGLSSGQQASAHAGQAAQKSHSHKS